MSKARALRIATVAAGAILACSAAGVRPLGAQELQLPVPAITIYPNDDITDDRLIERAFIASTVRRGSVMEDRRAVTGKVARRTLLPGQPIPVNAVRDPYLVQAGKNTVVVFQESGLVITGTATAQQSGGVGDVVSLRNIDSGTLIRGKVLADGTVRVGAP